MNSSMTPHKNAFQNFCVAKRVEYAEQPKQRTMKKLGIMWRRLTPEQKESYKTVPAHILAARAEAAAVLNGADAAATAQNVFLETSAAPAAEPEPVAAAEPVATPEPVAVRKVAPSFGTGPAARAAALAWSAFDAYKPVATPAAVLVAPKPAKPTVTRDEEELYYIREKRIIALTTQRDTIEGELKVLKQWNEAFRQTVRQRELLHHYGHL